MFNTTQTTQDRVLPSDLEEAIASEYYFTAMSGVLMDEHRNGGPLAVYEDCLNRLTFCVLVLKNDFTVTGQSSCVSPARFNAEIGKDLARKDALEKMWPLLGYALSTRLFEQSTTQGQ